MLCGSLVPRELVLTSLPYPIHFQERLSIDVPETYDLHLRNIYQHTNDLHGMQISMKPKSLSLRNIYQRYNAKPRTGIDVKLPVPTSLSIRLLYKKYISTPVNFLLSIPKVTDLFVRNILQRLRGYDKDELFGINLPEVTHLEIRDLVTTYDYEPIHELSIGIPDLTELSLRNAYNKHTVEREEFNLDIPVITGIDTTIKPKVYVPTLEGVENRTQGTNELKWSDASKTHSGYYLYRATEPITDDNLGLPYKTLDRDVKTYVDSGMNINTPYFYRVSPKTFLGNMLSNEVELIHYSQFSIVFTSQNTGTTPDYIPLRVDDNIIPLVPVSDIEHDQINFIFIERVVSDVTLKSEYEPTKEYILMRIFS